MKEDLIFKKTSKIKMLPEKMGSKERKRRTMNVKYQIKSKSKSSKLKSLFLKFDKSYYFSDLKKIL